MRPKLLVVTPLPPERNGIADYAHALIGALLDRYDITVACDRSPADAPAGVPAGVPKGVPVIHPTLAHRHLTPGARVLHQLGNNAGHGFVLAALRRLPGVVTLHDPALLHLHEVTGEPLDAILAGMAGSGFGADLADRYGRHRRAGLASGSDHALFDLAGEVLGRATAVVVHSRFARARLAALHGELRGPGAVPIAVIPHPLPPAAAAPSRAAARARLGIDATQPLVVTAGFAVRAKRLEWLGRALAQLPPPAPVWVHAGAGATGDPALRGCGRVTGWVAPAALADWLAAADLFVNLRFPSSGESSGVLARALAAGLPCIVSDTAAYAELPRDAVRHVPPEGGAGALARALRDLLGGPEAARALGARGQAVARATMALPVVAAHYAAAIEAAARRPSPAPPNTAVAMPVVALRASADLDAAAVARALGDIEGPCRLLLTTDDLDALARLTLDRPGLLRAVLPACASTGRTRIIAGPGGTGLLVQLDVPRRTVAAPA